ADGTQVLVTAAHAASIDRLASSLETRGATVDTLPTGNTPDDGAVAEAVTAASDADHVVVVTNRATHDSVDPDRRQALLAEELTTTAPLTAVAVNDAYDVAVLPDDAAFLASYSTTAPSMESVAAIISGEISPSGQLPVDVPDTDGANLFPIGFGLTW